ncbi:MAG: RIP metalloprotease RseP [Planctomycetota bacterium]
MCLLLTDSLPFLEFFQKIFLFVEVLFGIGLLIFIHEFGHFLAAKLFKVRVEIFSLGFGAPIQIGRWKLSTVYKDTEYRLAMVPFGGYVKMAGDWPGEDTTGANDEFTSKPVYQRMIIMAAGVTMNVFLSIFLFVIAYYIGVNFHAPKVGSVASGMPAWLAGIKSGDQIFEIDGEPIFTFDEIIPLIAFSQEEVEIKVKRAKDQKPGEFETKIFKVKPAYDEQLGFRAIGIRQSYKKNGKIVPGLAAYEAGLRTEDEIVSINGEPAKSKSNSEILSYAHDVLEPKPIEIEVIRPSENNQKKTIKLHPKEISYFIGIAMSHRFVDAVRGVASEFFQAGDEILLVDGKSLHVFHKIREYAQSLDTTQYPHIRFEIKRNEKPLTVEVPTSILQKDDFYGDLAPKSNNTILGDIIPDKPAEKAGFQVGDQIIKIDQKNVDSFAIMSSLISNSGGKPLEITFLRDQKEQTLQVTPATRYLFELGIEVGPDLLEKPLRSETFFEAISLGFKQTKHMAQQVFLMLVSLFTREVHPSNLGGPVTIFQASYTFAQFGIGRMIHWLALISINLAIINVLPIPVLDGGHLMFLFFEKLKGSPLNPQTMLIFQYIGLVFILILMVYVTFNDISRLFFG